MSMLAAIAVLALLLDAFALGFAIGHALSVK